MLFIHVSTPDATPIKKERKTATICTKATSNAPSEGGGKKIKDHNLTCKITWWNCISDDAYGRWYTYFVLGSTIRPFPPFTSKSCLHTTSHQQFIRNFVCPLHPCNHTPLSEYATINTNRRQGIWIVREAENSTGKQSQGWSAAHEVHIWTAARADRHTPLSSRSKCQIQAVNMQNRFRFQLTKTQNKNTYHFINKYLQSENCGLQVKIWVKNIYRLQSRWGGQI